jgi:hypothetical protein
MPLFFLYGAWGSKGDKAMAWLIILLVGFAGLHFGLLLPPQPAIIGATVLMAGLWIVWKLKWMILGIIGLEEVFGGKGDGA